VYESEVYKDLISETLPPDVLARFAETHRSVEMRSLLNWSEHCTECAIPSCYQLCELYTPRIDGKCQRFSEGIGAFYAADLPTQLLKIWFKKWGSLGTQANDFMLSPADALRREKADRVRSRFIHMAPGKLKRILIQRRYAAKKEVILQNQLKTEATPDAFLLECYNPNSVPVTLKLIFRSQDEKYKNFPFEYTIALEHGYNKETIPYAEIAKRINLNERYWISLNPQEIATELPLYFGLLEFVKFKEHARTSTKPQKIKCVVWDLDNTLWDGTLIEDGLEKLRLRKGVKETLAELESKGIINSIASKNDRAQAKAALIHFGLTSQFVFPKISWEPKSQGIKEVARELNISLDTLVFVDDSAFERSEVQHFLPEIRTIDPDELSDFINRETIAADTTPEAKNRKEFYQDEEKRKESAARFEGDYFDFLRACQITLTINRMAPASYDRIYELVRRTNQLNFSGILYDRAAIERLATNPGMDTFALSCTDKFGEYGIIGFAVIDRLKNRLEDLTFSCRIQSKRIEHAFITWCLRKYGSSDFYVRYNYTPLNRFSAQVFWDFGFEVMEKQGDIQFLKFDATKPIPEDGIVTLKSNL
jgi:FkbH-like protein